MSRKYWVPKHQKSYLSDPYYLKVKLDFGLSKKNADKSNKILLTIVEQKKLNGTISSYKK